ncbi:MAG: hypothetical protein SGPRY_012973, partial [Prymnesium sp.]
MLASLLASLSLLSASPAVLRVRDPKSLTTCVLVGAMHYNPASIALAEATVREEAREGRLRAVAVESCETRWNATLAVGGLGGLSEWICFNEMQAAAQLGAEYG